MDDPVKKKSQVISLSDEEGVKEVLLETILGLWKIVNNLTRLRTTTQEHYRVTIFGSSRAEPGTVAYEEVKKIAQELAIIGCDVVTGGGPGLMQAANEGVGLAGVKDKGRSIGIAIDLPFEQKVNPFVTQAYEHGTFFTRLHHFVLSSNAFVIAPGGIGTTLEAMMIWQLLQVKHVEGAPLIFVGKMWADFLEWARTHFLRADVNLADPEDLDIPLCVETADEVVSILRHHHAAWEKI